MPQAVDSAGVEKLVADGAHLVEVLGHRDYGREHLPGAVNVPLWELDAERLAAAGVERGRPVVVYCFDFV